MRPSSFSPRDLDTSIAPTDDFFSYVNAKWIASNPMPETEVRWGAFYLLREENRERLRRIMEELAERDDLGGGTDEKKLADLWRSGMDEARIESLGLEAIRPELSMIESLTSLEDMPPVLAHLQAIGVDPFWDIHVNEDWKQNDRYALYVFQDGIGLPERDYYLSDDEKMVAIRGSYRSYLTALLSLGGYPHDVASSASERVIALESRLAEASMSPVELRDIGRMYNRVPFARLAEYVPLIEWRAFMDAFGVPPQDELIVAQPEFLERCQEILADTPLETIREYLVTRLLDSVAPLLGSTFVSAHFDFHGKVLTGAQEIQPRWKRVLALVDGAMGEALGRNYVEKHFPPEAKERVDTMVDNLLSAYRGRIETLKWMSAETKEKALAKLGRMRRKLGYPDRWRDYTNLEIDADTLVQNAFRANRFETERRNAKLGGPVDRDEWSMTPPTVNAYNDLVQNEIVFPAGIMQPPFFAHDHDDAINYGAMGAVIGHEITHGFDDQGSHFDAEGNLSDWWASSDKERFNALTKRMVACFDRYVAVDDVHVNGELTVGENIADLGGVIMAYYAYRAHRNGVDDIRDGLTADQRFFIGWAIGQRGYWRDEMTRVAVRTDPHAPPKWRVNGPFSQLAEFHDAFGTQPGDGMWVPPEERISIW